MEKKIYFAKVKKLLVLAGITLALLLTYFIIFSIEEKSFSINFFVNFIMMLILLGSMSISLIKGKQNALYISLVLTFGYAYLQGIPSAFANLKMLDHYFNSDDGLVVVNGVAICFQCINGIITAIMAVCIILKSFNKFTKYIPTILGSCTVLFVFFEIAYLVATILGSKGNIDIYSIIGMCLDISLLLTIYFFERHQIVSFVDSEE